MPACADERTSHSYAGHFSVSAGNGALVLTRASGDLRLIFNAVARHDLPEVLDGLRVERARGDSGAGAEFRVHSAAGSHTLSARSLQVHERAALYGNVIRLPRYAMRERLQWSLLLWAARFAWGQALIRRLTGAGPR